MQDSRVSALAGNRGKTFRQIILDNSAFLLMIAIPVVYVIIFSYIPMGGVILAFKNYKYRLGILGSPWVGLNNFKFFFISGAAGRTIRNTLLYNTAFIVLGMFTEVVFAIILNELRGRGFKRTAQSLMLLPFFISWVVVSSIVYSIISYEHGLLNNIITAFGGSPVNVYAKPTAWPFIMVFLRLWKGAGYGCIIYLANITSIDPEIYEAAEIDGANIWQKTRSITLQHLRSTMVIMLLLAMGGMFRGDFGMFYQMVKNNGVLLPYTDIIDTFVFRALLSSADVGMSAASGLFQSLLCLITILSANFVVTKIDPDYALF
ncbi:MAG: sugar ABC transporter permease [Oscillospiraceae bacterium]|jgi:putative aldouronate transport system permease protein|nr:sugar ABC transporter permease [Oscillospiraceae bacterium]